MPGVKEAVRAKTGQLAPESGAYRCLSCGEQINIDAGEHIPPCPKDAGTNWEMSTGGTGARGSSRTEASKPSGRSGGSRM